MIKPIKFYYNPQTAVNNAYQKNLKEDPELVAKKALEEFDALVNKMKSVGIEVNVIQDSCDFNLFIITCIIQFNDQCL